MGERAQEAATSIAEQATRMTNLVRQLLDFARRKAPQRDVVDLEAIACRTADLVETVATKANVRFDVYMAGNMPKVHGRQQPARAGAHQSLRERHARHAGRRNRPCVDEPGQHATRPPTTVAQRRTTCRSRFVTRARGIAPEALPTPVRALLHDEGRRGGNRPRPCCLLWDRPRPRRMDRREDGQLAAGRSSPSTFRGIPHDPRSLRG